MYICKKGIHHHFCNVVYLRLETVARGLGFTEMKNGKEYVMWRRVLGYLRDFGFGTSVENSQKAGISFRPQMDEGENFPASGERPEFIPENIFYRLAMKAKNEVANAIQDEVFLV